MENVSRNLNQWYQMVPFSLQSSFISLLLIHFSGIHVLSFILDIEALNMDKTQPLPLGSPLSIVRDGHVHSYNKLL